METRTKLFLSLLIGVALLHSGALRNGFVWDDRQMIVTNPEIRDLDNIPAMFMRNYFGERANSELYRPLVNVSLALDYDVWGKDGRGRPIPLPYHATNILLHLAAGLLLYALLRRLIDRPWIPEVASLLFLVHPASAEPVAWIVARGDLLATVFALGAIHCHLSGRRRWPFHIVALILYLAALFSKLAAAPLPILILLLGRKDWIRCATYALPAALYLWVRSNAMPTLFPSGPGLTWDQPEFLSSAVVSGAVTFRMLWISLFPAGLSAEYSTDPVTETHRHVEIASYPVVFLAVVAVPAIVAAALIWRRRAPLVTTGLLWFFVALLPVSQAIRIGAVMADRFLYLPSIGFAVALAAIVLSLPRKRIVAIAVLLALFGAGTRHREAVWRNEGTMAADVLRATNYPGNGDAWNRLGMWHGAEGRSSEEIKAYREGLRHDARNRYLRLSLGAALFEAGRYPEARTVLTRAFADTKPTSHLRAKIAYNLARVLIEQGEDGEAARVLEEVVSVKPPFPASLELLAWVYEKRLDRPMDAAALRERAEKIRDDARRAVTAD